MNAKPTVLSQLGSGGFAQVYLGLMGNTLVAMKRLVFPKMHAPEIPLECYIHSLLTHEHINRLISFYKVSFNRYVMVTSVLLNSDASVCSDLFQLLTTKELSQGDCLRIFGQLASAISYLHSLNIAHNDIKDENILVNDRGEIKVIGLFH